MHERFIARQPIFDHRVKVFAYELLFRAGPRNAFQTRKDASSSVIVDSTMLFDLQTLIGHAKAFVNADETALLQGAVQLLPAERIVVEILETVVPSPEVVAACAALREAGYILALDDFIDHPKWEPLLPHARFLKVDFRISDRDACRKIAERYIPQGFQLLAEKVETAEDVDLARKMGYTYFQGYFFCKPMMVEGRHIPGNKLIYLRLMEAVSTSTFRFPQIEEILKQDPSLVYKLLRYLNSSLLGLRSEVRSVSHALSLIGETDFRRWISIVALVSLAGDKPHELIHTALTRAYFCEEMASRVDLSPQRSDLFLMGLLSVTDAILDLPMSQILSSLPLSSEVSTALSGGENRFRHIYDALLAYERADWKKLASCATKVKLAEDHIPECYLSATKRAAAVSL